MTLTMALTIGAVVRVLALVAQRIWTARNAGPRRAGG